MALAAEMKMHSSHAAVKDGPERASKGDVGCTCMQQRRATHAARELLRMARGAPAGVKDRAAAPSASSTAPPLWPRLWVACRQRMPPTRRHEHRPRRDDTAEELRDCDLVVDCELVFHRYHGIHREP